MFRKLVSNLPYSPALIADIGFYANRLRDEEATRRTTVLFVVLALIVQSLAVFTPPESANASSEQDIIRGGVADLNDFLIRYDHNEQDVKDIFNAAGVTRSEIAAAKPGKIHASDDTYLLSRYGQLSDSAKEVSMAYQRSAGGVGIRYFSPLEGMGGKGATFSGWVGESEILGWFGIIQSNGSLATKGLPTTIDPADATILSVTKTVTALNLSQGSMPIETTVAKPNDKIMYSLKVLNPHAVSITTNFNVRIDDLLEYSTVVDSGGGTLDDKTNYLSWSQVQLRPGESQTRTFAVQMFPSFPATAAGQSNPASYDCKMTIVYGKELSNQIECPPIKSIEGILNMLPPMNAGTNVIFGLSVLGIVAFFYVRTRQLKKEIRIIRHNFNTGVI